MEGLTHHERPEKSRRLSVEEIEETNPDANSRTKCPVILGAKSGIGRDLTTRRKMGARNGLDLKSLTEKEGGNASLGLDERTDKFL